MRQRRRLTLTCARLSYFTCDSFSTSTRLLHMLQPSPAYVVDSSSFPQAAKRCSRALKIPAWWEKGSRRTSSRRPPCCRAQWGFAFFLSPPQPCFKTQVTDVSLPPCLHRRTLVFQTHPLVRVTHTSADFTSAASNPPPLLPSPCGYPTRKSERSVCSPESDAKLFLSSSTTTQSLSFALWCIRWQKAKENNKQTTAPPALKEPDATV